jgi:hypothetical protein
MVEWFTQYDLFGFPADKATVGGCELSVAFVGGQWQWLVRCEGRDVAERPARSGRGAKQRKRPVEAACRDFRSAFTMIVSTKG